MAKGKKSNIVGLVWLLGFSIVILAGVFYWRFGEKVSRVNPEIVPSATPTPIPLHSGSAKYNISQSKHSGPTFTTVVFDPVDVKKGGTLNLSINVKNPSDITSVKGIINMDSSSKIIDFSLKEGTAKDGLWVAKIILEDSVNYIYTLSLTASASNGKSTISVSPR